jgi:hypothetical protein
MKTLKLTLLLITILCFSAYSKTFDFSKPPDDPKDYILLVTAVFIYESNNNPKAFNEKELATGPGQIRPCRVQHYNDLMGTHYKLHDFANHEKAKEMFLFFARGKSFEKAAKSWNGSGPMTITYWNNVKLILNKLMAIDFNPQSYAAYKLMHDGTIALNHAEQNGFRVDLNYIVKKKDHLKKKMKAAELVFKAGYFFKEWQGSVKDEVNIYSGIQLGKFLYNVKGIKAVKLTATGKGSVDAEALEELDLPELSFYKTRNKFKKAIDVLTGFETEQVNGILHPSYNLHIARTFRSSANSPNMQNIPKRDNFLLNVCRGAIVPRSGHQLMEIDFKGIEVAINACINKDPNLIKYVSDPKSDMHGDMAKEIFKIPKFDKNIDAHATLRQAAKNGFVFPEFYGDFYKQCAVYLAHDWGKLPKGRWKPGDGIEMPEGNLADHMINNGIRSLDGFTEHLKKIERNFWDVRFKQYSWWKNSMWELYRKYGYVELPTGFRCGGLMIPRDVYSYMPQGSAFHCLLWSFIKTDAFLENKKTDTILIGQIHDSMILDCHPSEIADIYASVRNITTKLLPEAWKWIIVPLDVDAEICGVDEPWSNKKKYVG